VATHLTTSGASDAKSSAPASVVAVNSATPAAASAAPSAAANPVALVDPTPSVLPPSIASMLGPDSRNPIVMSMLEQNAPPLPYAAVGQGSIDPAVYRTDGYIKALNLNSFLQIANHDNCYRFQQYDFQLREWSSGGMQGPPPPPPKYETVDLKGFDNWWAQYSTKLGDAPPCTFITNGPTGSNYGWSA
jgi:hypothetical protein